MPYNTTAIVPSEEVTGSAILPLARVKKTINADEDIGNVSAQAAFVICKATEFFVQYAAEKSYEIAKAEAKPKRSLTYSHVSNAVARNDNLEFLSDIAPQTTTWRNYKESRAGQKASSRGSKALDPKQTTLGGTVVGAGSSAAGVAAAVSGAATTNKADLSLAMHPVDAGPGPVNGAGKEVGKGRGRAKDVDGDVNMS